MAATDPGFIAALEQARIGEAEGGIPVRLKPASCFLFKFSRIKGVVDVLKWYAIKVGAAIISQDGTIIGRGRNGLVQKNSGVTHVRHPIVPDNCIVI
jgi:tRNA(Arg) A34 adenosine deaminase TadA